MDSTNAGGGGGGGAKRRLTSKNLFDEVFAAIPATSYLHLGPQSLMEELAMQDEADSKAASSHIVGVSAGNEEEDDDALMFGSGGGGEAGSVGEGEDAIHATPWATVAAHRVGGAAKAKNTQNKAADSDELSMRLEMDTEDEAFREATKHAAYLSQFKQVEAQQEAERAERHRLRLAEQAAAMAGEDERRPSHGHQRQQLSHHQDDRRGRQGVGNRYTNSSNNSHRDDDGKDRYRGANTGRREGAGGGGGGGAEDGRQRQPHRDEQGHDPQASARHQMSAEEQLRLMPPGLCRLYTGHCVMLRSNRGYGFLSPDLGGPDVYFIKDSVVLTFTRLVLQAFYAKHGLEVPASTVLPGEKWDAPELTGSAQVRAPLVVSTLADLSPRVPTAATTTQGEKDDVQSERAAPVADGATAATLASEGGSAIELNPHSRATDTSTVSSPSDALANPASPPPLPDLVTSPTHDSNPVPPITIAEREAAVRASALLTKDTAQLLQWAMDNTLGSSSSGGGTSGGGGLLGNLHSGGGGGGGGMGYEDCGNGGDPGGVVVSNRDPLTFTVHRNKSTGGGSRLLRAEFVRGVPETFYALPLEQSWLYPLFPGAIGVKAATDGGRDGEGVGGRRGNDQDGATGPILTRYTGSVRAYNVEDRRGYIRCDEPGARQDVCFYASAFLWDPALPPAQHAIAERLRVVYSVAGIDRNSKYLATLVTSFKDGKPFRKDNFVFLEDERDGRGGGGGGGRRGGGGGGGTRDEVDALGHSSSGAGGDSGNLKRYRAEEEDHMLLFEEDDYAMI